MGWGYSWYINGTLIPRLIVSRGYNYTFISEGGEDAANPGRYHPFYLTSSVTGGRLKNTGPQREVYIITINSGLERGREGGWEERRKREGGREGGR